MKRNDRTAEWGRAGNKGDNNSGKIRGAEGAVMAAGIAAILLFFFLSAGNSEVKPLTYDNSANAEYNTAIPAYAEVSNSQNTDRVPVNKGENSGEDNKNTNSSSAENTSATWNFWEAFSDFLEKIFRAGGYIPNEKP